MRSLARTLVLSGIGMTLCGGSYPASQGEHLISHYVDMFAPAQRCAYLHGEQVAVATLTMARIQEACWRQDRRASSPSAITEAELRAGSARRSASPAGASSRRNAWLPRTNRGSNVDWRIDGMPCAAV